MKLAALISAAAFAWFASSAVADAMSTIPYSGGGKSLPGFNGVVRPDDPGSAVDPYAPPTPFSPPRAADRNARSPYARGRSADDFLNADPFDPNSVVNSFDRQRYANPYPYDPVYNPYGQGPSRYAPMGPNAPIGQREGIPFGR